MGYFDEQIAQGKPIVPPLPPTASSPISPVAEGEFPGTPVRVMGDRIFLLRGGKKFWVTNPETYSKLGFKFGDEVKIDQTTLDVIPEGEPLR